MQAPPFPRADLPTPALVLDRAALERNIARMAAFAAARGLALRPHAKTHRSADIGRLQVAAGAVGLCCAKLGEADALAAEGLANLHLTLLDKVGVRLDKFADSRGLVDDLFEPLSM